MHSVLYIKGSLKEATKRKSTAMEFACLIIPVLLLSVLISGDDPKKDPLVEKFGECLKEKLGQKAYDTIYALNYKDRNDLRNASIKAQEKFEEVFGVKFEPAEENEEDEQIDRLSKVAKKEDLFKSQVITIGTTLKNKGNLTESNVCELAEKLEKQIKSIIKTKKLKDTDNVHKTLVGLAIADATFFKDLHLNTKEVAHEYAKNEKNALSSLERTE